MIKPYKILRYGVLIGLIVLIGGLVVYTLFDLAEMPWIGIYLIISTPLASVSIIFISNIRSEKTRVTGILALIELLVVITYILIVIHVL